MNKKEKTNPWIVLLWIVTVLVIAVFLLLILLEVGIIKEPFDPEKHVCLEWKIKCRQRGYGEWYQFNDNIQEHICGGATQIRSESKCLDWRPKTICELYPNNKECVCDEYGDTSYKLKFTTKEINPPEISKEDKYVMIRIKSNTTITLDDFRYKTSCIKSHLANECEKENPDYVLDYENCPFEFRWEENSNISSIECGEQTCRKKTICELEPNNEECICDVRLSSEAIYFVNCPEQNVSFNYSIKTENKHKLVPFKETPTVYPSCEVRTYIGEGACIKSHLPEKCPPDPQPTLRRVSR